MAVLGHAITFGKLPCSICGIAWINVAACHVYPPSLLQDTKLLLRSSQ
jgi:hypothetical protein